MKSGDVVAFCLKMNDPNPSGSALDLRPLQAQHPQSLWCRGSGDTQKTQEGSGQCQGAGSSLPRAAGRSGRVLRKVQC